MINHLVDRNIDLSLHKVWIDTDVAVFPIYNISGQMVGYQQYRPSTDKKRKNNPKDGRYFTFTNKDNRGLWGLESFGLSDALFVCEGVFDAAQITKRGFSAVATLSNDPKFLSDLFFILRQHKKVVSICDHGKAGIKLAKYGSAYHVMPSEFDLGDASSEYVDNLIKEFK